MNKRILVVEDNEINRNLLKMILQDEFDVIEAENGKQALSVIREKYEELSAVVLDLLMPEMSGIELMKVLHEDDRFDNLPILVATGDHNAQVEKECLSNGAWDFVVKPYEPSIIKLRLSNIIGKSQSSLMEQVKELAQKDTLTGIYNRAYFMNQTAQMIRIHRDIQFILVRVDIDYFRNYNASFGTDAGNELICSMAQRIKKNVMDSGLEYATYGRIESDVFCICVPYHRELLMKAIQDTDEQLHSLKNNYSLKASFGLYIIENPDEDMEKMYGRTLEAVRECKHNVNQLYTFYNQAMEENERIAQFLSGEMGRAIKERQFVVYLQPKYSMESNSPCGAEALVRWNHPDKGMISPGQFIPVFEKNGMIIQLDYYMWDSVCSLLGEWIKEGRTVYPVSVNISRISLNNPAIVDQILNLTKKYQVPRELLQLEITESAYMSNPELMKSIISGFRKHGFMILMDDFGSGYSSLNTLKNIEVDILKIDMKFLPTGNNNVKSEKILASVIRMAGWLGMPVIVEGVETKEQVDFVVSIGCNFIQGFYFARPMPVEEYEQLIEQERIYQPKDTRDSEEMIQKMDEIWSSDMNSATLLQSVALPFAILEYGNGEVDVLRMNDNFRNHFGSTLFQEQMNLHEKRKLIRTIEEVIESKEKGQCECLFSNPVEGNRWQDIRIVYIGTIDKTSLLSMTLTDVTTEHMLENEMNQIFNAMKKSNHQRNKILIVDDLEVSRDSLVSLFEDEYAVVTAVNGIEALHILKEDSDDIIMILLDMLMPEMDGKEFLSYKNSMPRVADIPVIIISTEANESLQINMLECGVNDYVTKPFIPAVVRKRVRNVIEYNSRFRHLVQEFNAASQAETPTLKGINLTRYNQYDIHMMIQFMGKIFDVVRLVDPKKTSVVTLLPEGGVKEEDYCCFKVWGKEKRCENCTSMCSMEGHCMINKFELMKENIFYVISQPVKVKVGHNTERELVLEIVSKITDEKTIPQGEVREV